MEILNSQRHKLFIILLFLFIITSCSNNNSRYCINDRLEYLQSFGFEFYERLDTFSLKGINAIDTFNIKYPFYAICNDGTSVDIQYFTSFKNVSYRSYKKINNYYISTKVYADEELRDVFSKEIIILYDDKIILYNYIIYDDFERLLDISFLYKNGEKKMYYNATDSYYNLCDTLQEENISTLFPTMYCK